MFDAFNDINMDLLCHVFTYLFDFGTFQATILMIHVEIMEINKKHYQKCKIRLSCDFNSNSICNLGYMWMCYYEKVQ